MPWGPTHFQLTNVKPFYKEALEEEQRQGQGLEEPDQDQDPDPNQDLDTADPEQQADNA